MAKVPVDDGEAVLSSKELEQLIKFAVSVPERFPMLQDAQGKSVPADIEFGFYRDRLVLFQIRPFLESPRARHNIFLNRLDQRLEEKQTMLVDLDRIPVEVSQ